VNLQINLIDCEDNFFWINYSLHLYCLRRKLCANLFQRDL